RRQTRRKGAGGARASTPTAAANGRLRDLPRTANERETCFRLAALIVRQVPIVIVRQDHPGSEIGDDRAFRTLEDRSVRDSGYVDVVSGRVRLEATLIPNQRDGSAPTVSGMFEARFQLYWADVGIVLVADLAINLDRRRRAGVNRIPHQIHGMG